MSLYGGTGLPGTSDYAKIYDSLQKNPQITAEPVLYSVEPTNEEAEKSEEDHLGKQKLAKPVFQPRRQPASKLTQSIIPKAQIIPSKPPVQRSKFETWTKDTYDVTPMPKRQRRNKKSKVVNWDDEYDPSRPSVYEEYKSSNEQSRMLDEYQQYLHGRDHLIEEVEDDGYMLENPDMTHIKNGGDGYSAFNSSLIPEKAPQNIPLPGQRNFAKRLLHKYGWEEGQGLGAASTGITKPLAVKTKHGGHGKIVDKNKPREASPIIVLDGLHMTEEDVQDIGDECSRVYGQIERILVKNQRIFVLFCSLESAARAVYALDGRVFDQEPIKASYFSLERFHKGDYG